MVDDYHGTPVADPYRWLEDPDSDETRAFVAAQNALSRSHLDCLGERQALLARLHEVWDVPRIGLPQRRDGVTVWAVNDGLLDQPVYHVDREGDGTAVELLDPNALSEDGTVAVTVTALSPDGRWFGYSVAESGSDWQSIRVRDVASGEDLDDVIEHVKFSPIAWYEQGFFYARFPAVDHRSTETVRDVSICYHRIGTSQADDEVLYRNTENPDLGYVPHVTEDDRFLLLVEWEGTSLRFGILYRDLTVDDSGWTRLLPVGEARYEFVHHDQGRFWFLTDRDAPNGAVISMAVGDPSDVRTVIPESSVPIESVVAAAGRLVTVGLEEAQHRIDTYTLDGERLEPIGLPGPGTVSGVSGTWDDPVVFVGYESFTRPPTALRWEAGAATPMGEVDPPLDPAAVVVDRHEATSTDGRPVGMFVVRHRDTPLPAPVELYGYGGFAINMTPMFDPARLAFLEAGGVVVVANLRGGAELGEKWHEQGMLAAKQQVFDDFISCAEYLVSAGITTTERLGIRGRSNGGLLTAAVLMQRPDLFGAVVSTVPVADMLRYQHFTAGRYWTVEYGDPADADAFDWLIRYSPIHNVREGEAYPPLLITTGESDDRVVPMHSFKLAAAIQHAGAGSSETPWLLRVDTKAGHGLGKPTSKLIEEAADVYGFLLHHLNP